MPRGEHRNGVLGQALLVLLGAATAVSLAPLFVSTAAPPTTPEPSPQPEIAARTAHEPVQHDRDARPPAATAVARPSLEAKTDATPTPAAIPDLGAEELAVLPLPVPSRGAPEPGTVDQDISLEAQGATEPTPPARLEETATVPPLRDIDSVSRALVWEFDAHGYAQRLKLHIDSMQRDGPDLVVDRTASGAWGIWVEGASEEAVRVQRASLRERLGYPVPQVPPQPHQGGEHESP